jgi:hypothetical protein
MDAFEPFASLRAGCLHVGTFRGFVDYVGVKRSTRKASSLGIIISLLFALPVLALILTNPAFVEVMTDPQSFTGRIRQSCGCTL